MPSVAVQRQESLLPLAQATYRLNRSRSVIAITQLAGKSVCLMQRKIFPNGITLTMEELLTVKGRYRFLYEDKNN